MVKKPTFFILGAAKCGTTFIYDLLKTHPDICMSIPKEPFFFEAEYEKGLEYYWNKYFSNWKGQKEIGEARHRNLYLPYVANRIKEIAPDAKLIISLRNPVDRAYSHWWFWYSMGKENLLFEDAIYEDIKRIEKGINFEGEKGAIQWCNNLDFKYGKNEFRTYIDSGYYSRQIMRYKKLFPSEQIKILFLEDFVDKYTEVILEVFEFLEVDLINVTKIRSRQNASISRGAMWLKEALKSLCGEKIANFLPLSIINALLKLLSKININNKKPMNPATRKDLINHYYKYNRELEKITGRDLTHWDI